MGLVTTYLSALEARADESVLQWEGRAVSARELLEESARLAAELRQVGLREGQPALLSIDNGPGFLAAYFALVRCGATVAMLSPKSGDEEFGAVRQSLRPAIELTDPRLGGNSLELLGQAAAMSLGAIDAPPAEELADVALIKYTSGSLGSPKGILLSESNLLAEAQNVVNTLGLEPGDRILCNVSFCHSYGFDLGVLPALGKGMTLIGDATFTPHRTLEHLRQDIGVFLGVPSMYRVLLDSAPEDPPELKARWLLSCTAPLQPELIEEFHQRFGAIICQHYGSSETGGATLHEPTAVLERVESVGRAMQGVELIVVDEAGNPVAPGELGEVVIRSEVVALGYAPGYEPDPDPFQPEGYRTGDLGQMDENGYLHLIGRKDDIINVGGFKVSPVQVARVLEAFEPVAEAAVVGIEDERGETLVVAVVTLRAPTDEAAILEHCRGRLEPHKIPRRVEIRDELPRGATGKVKLRPSDVQAPSEEATDLAGQVVACLRRSALAGSRREVEMNRPLSELGLDSLGLVGFFVALEKEFGISLLESDWMSREEQSLDSLIRHLESSKSEAARATASRERSALENVLRTVARRIYEAEDFVVLRRALRRSALPSVECEGFTIRNGTPADLDGIAGLYSKPYARYKRQKAADWLQRGYDCFLAVDGDRVVGIDWMAPPGHFDGMTGMCYRGSADCCFGLDLDEHPEHKGRRIGMALLAHSLHVARERGLRAQYTVVAANNTPMLSASIQLMGFEKVGRIETRRWLRRPRSRWRIGSFDGVGDMEVDAGSSDSVAPFRDAS